jgi:MFS family permease
MKNELQISLLLIGLIFAINAIFGGFVQIYAGHLGDKYGFKRIILIFAFTYILTLLLLFSSALFFPIPMVFVLLFIVNQADNAFVECAVIH